MSLEEMLEYLLDEIVDQTYRDRDNSAKILQQIRNTLIEMDREIRDLTDNRC